MRLLAVTLPPPTSRLPPVIAPDPADRLVPVIAAPVIAPAPIVPVVVIFPEPNPKLVPVIAPTVVVPPVIVPDPADRDDPVIAPPLIAPDPVESEAPEIAPVLVIAPEPIVPDPNARLVPVIVPPVIAPELLAVSDVPVIAPELVIAPEFIVPAPDIFPAFVIPPLLLFIPPVISAPLASTVNPPAVAVMPVAAVIVEADEIEPVPEVVILPPVVMFPLVEDMFPLAVEIVPVPDVEIFPLRSAVKLLAVISPAESMFPDAFIAAAVVVPVALSVVKEPVLPEIGEAVIVDVFIVAPSIVPLFISALLITTEPVPFGVISMFPLFALSITILDLPEVVPAVCRIKSLVVDGVVRYTSSVPDDSPRLKTSPVILNVPAVAFVISSFSNLILSSLRLAKAFLASVPSRNILAV
jgi:hypothetical protein